MNLHSDPEFKKIINQETLRLERNLNPDTETLIALFYRDTLVNAFKADYYKTNDVISDETIRKEYEILKIQMGDKEYKARHILVETEVEAKDIIAKIKKGANFAKIAKEKTIDDGSREKGGELNWSPPAAYVRPFSEALVKLSKGGLTGQPVQTSFGWHVIQLMDTRPMEVPPFEEVKQNIKQRILQREYETFVRNLRSNAKLE